MSNNDELSRTYAETCKPGLQKVLSLLHLDIPYVRAEGENLYFTDCADGGGEIAVADYLGGYGSTILGHHPPGVRSAVIDSLEKGEPIHAQASVRGGAARLGQELNRLIGRPYFAHFLNTGTEATEAAIKHAHMEWRLRQETALAALTHYIPRVDARTRELLEKAARAVTSTRPVLFALEGSFHGKTAGALSATDNPSYCSMYPERPVQCRFIPRSATPEDIDRFFSDARLELAGHSFSTALGVIAEVIQGEAGVRPINTALLTYLRQKTAEEGIPLIVDEIQSGIWRTGTFLACLSREIVPDYLLLGKSLGGGIAKISALLVSADRYQPEFGIKHTSTFAEDDLSCAAALATLRELERRSDEIAQRARVFEARIRDCCERMMRECPGVIREVRGEGFFMGIEFRADADSPELSHAMAGLIDTGHFVYVLSSYLLERHRVRVGAGLNASNTLRMEPSAFVSPAAVDRLVAAIEDVTRLIYANRVEALTAHLWERPEEHRGSLFASPRRPYPVLRPTSGRPLRTVFLTHLINVDHLRDVDPLFQHLSEKDRRRYVEEFGPIAGATMIFQQAIRGPGGREIVFELRGFAAATDFFERAIRTGNGDAGRMVCGEVERADRSGATHVGLGQYTSIVTDNGLRIRTERAKVTTGNSLTVGFSYQTLRQILERRGMDLCDLHVAVVGVAGNIGNIHAQLLGDEARRMTLVHRETFEKSQKFRDAVATVIANSSIDISRIRPTTDMSLLAECDVVVLATNSAQAFLRPEHLKKNAIVLDISVPSNIHESLHALRSDVECFRGGYARLPLGQTLVCPMVPVPDGEVFACMAETIMTGLLNYGGNYSRGDLSKKHVTDVLRLAAEAGIECGCTERTPIFRAAASVPPARPAVELRHLVAFGAGQ